MTHLGDPARERLEFNTIRLDTHKGAQVCAEIVVPSSFLATSPGSTAPSATVERHGFHHAVSNAVSPPAVRSFPAVRLSELPAEVTVGGRLLRRTSPELLQRAVAAYRDGWKCDVCHTSGGRAATAVWHEVAHGDTNTEGYDCCAACACAAAADLTHV